ADPDLEPPLSHTLFPYPTLFRSPAVPPALDPDPARPEGMRELSERLAAADAFVIVTPDYNRSYPAALKAAIDWHFTQWDAKAVRSEEHTSELQSRENLVCRLLLE